MLLHNAMLLAVAHTQSTGAETIACSIEAWSKRHACARMRQLLQNALGHPVTGQPGT
jgi:hypothetical protein